MDSRVLLNLVTCWKSIYFLKLLKRLLTNFGPSLTDLHQFLGFLCISGLSSSLGYAKASKLAYRGHPITIFQVRMIYKGLHEMSGVNVWLKLLKTPFLLVKKQLCSQRAISVHVSLNDNELCWPRPSLPWGRVDTRYMNISVWLRGGLIQMSSYICRNNKKVNVILLYVPFKLRTMGQCLDALLNSFFF